MATNEILQFASTDTGTNLLTQAEYSADAQRTTGNQPGIARSKLVNKALRQTATMSAGLAEFIADYQTNNVTDGATPQNISDWMAAAVRQAAFATGTRLAFAQSSAPTGWTKVTSDDANNRMLRVVTTAGGATGGSHSPILNNVVPAHAHSFSTGGASGDHTHSGWTGIQSSNHAHDYVTPMRAIGDSDRGTQNSDWSIDNTTTYVTSIQNNDHAHFITTGGQSQSHVHSGATDNGTSQTNWTPRYIDLILCEKA